MYYLTGQGMGLYSSWTAIAITHHLLILLSAHRCGLYNFKDYAVLGDDVVIADERVAFAYKDIIESIGLDIRLPKTISPVGEYVPMEFASKLVFNGVNISPLPIGLLINGGMQGLLEFLTRTYNHCSSLGKSELFWNDLRVHGPPFGKTKGSSSRVPEATGRVFKTDSILTLWGFSLFREKVKLYLEGKLSAQ